MGEFNWNGLFTRWEPGKKLYGYFGQITTDDGQRRNSRLTGKTYRKAGLPAEVLQAIDGLKKKPYKLHENAQRLSKALAKGNTEAGSLSEAAAAGTLRSVSDLHALRSFAWTIGDYQKRTGAEYDRLSLSELTAIVKAVKDAGYLNYRGGSFFPGLCSSPDNNVYFLPSQLSRELRKAAGADGAAVASLNRLRKDLTRIKPVMENLAMELFGGTAGTETEFFETVLSAWCALAVLSKEPFFLTDGRKKKAETKAAKPVKAEAKKPAKAAKSDKKTEAAAKKAGPKKEAPKKAEKPAKAETKKTDKAVKSDKKAQTSVKKSEPKKSAAKKSVKTETPAEIPTVVIDAPVTEAVTSPKNDENYLVAEVDGELVRIPAAESNSDATIELLSKNAIPEAVLADAKKILPRLSEMGSVDMQYLSKRLTELQEDSMANNDPGRERTVEELIAELMGTAQSPKAAAPAPAPAPAPAVPEPEPAPAPAPVIPEPAPAPSPVDPEWEVSSNSVIKNDIEPEWEVSLVNPAAIKPAPAPAPAPVIPEPAPAPIPEAVPTPEEIAANAVIPEILPYIAPEPEAVKPAPAPAPELTPEEIAASAVIPEILPYIAPEPEIEKPAPAAEPFTPELIIPEMILPEQPPIIPEPEVIPEPEPEPIPEPVPEPVVEPEPAPAPEPVKPVSSIPDIAPAGVKPAASTFETNQASQTEMDEHEAAVRRRMREILEQNKKKQQEKDEVRRQMEERRLEVARRQEQRRQEILAKRKADYERLLAEQEDLRKVVEENKNAIMGDRKKKRTEAQRRIMDIEDIILKEDLDLKRGTNDYHTGLTQELY